MISEGMKKLNEDLKFGLNMEQETKKYIEKHFNDKITKTSQYCAYDYQGENAKYEIKSRRTKYAAYPTTIFPVSKCDTKGRLVILFHFTDGLWFVEYNATKFSNYLITDIGAYRGYGNWTDVKHYHIPIGDLTRIEI